MKSVGRRTGTMRWATNALPSKWHWLWGGVRLPEQPEGRAGRLNRNRGICLIRRGKSWSVPYYWSLTNWIHINQSKAEGRLSFLRGQRLKQEKPLVIKVHTMAAAGEVK